MMSVFEYAMDVEKTVEEILKKCKELQIDATNEEDMLDEDAITELDNVLAQEPAEEDYDEIDEIEDALIEKEKNSFSCNSASYLGYSPCGFGRLFRLS